jgi:hypothetical protein
MRYEIFDHRASGRIPGGATRAIVWGKPLARLAVWVLSKRDGNRRYWDYVRVGQGW